MLYLLPNHEEKLRLGGEDVHQKEVRNSRRKTLNGSQVHKNKIHQVLEANTD